MALSGYIREAARKNGGIRKLGLINRASIATVVFNSANTTIQSLTFSGTAKFSKYEFREDQAQYKETISMSGGSPVVEHEIRFQLERMGGDTTSVIDELVKGSLGGLVAFVETANGDSFIVGYSQEFGSERPLRLFSVVGTTGMSLREGTVETITMRSEDVSKAKPFTGIVTSLF